MNADLAYVIEAIERDTAYRLRRVMGSASVLLFWHRIEKAHGNVERRRAICDDARRVCDMYERVEDDEHTA
jgi:hypothetical protein